MIALNLAYNKNKLYRMIQRQVQFLFFRKESGNSYSTTFCVWFFNKMLPILNSINWPNFTAWLPFLLEILDNMCIAIAFFTDSNVINFEINPIYLIKSFFTLTSIEDKDLNISRTKEFLWSNKKHFFIIFKGLLILDNLII